MLSQTTVNKKDDHYQALFQASMPSKIRVSYQLPNESREILHIDPQSFARERGMTQWNETILINPTIAYIFGKDQFTGQTLNEYQVQDIVKQTTRHLSDLVIANMGNILGYGVYTTKFIAKGEAIAIYAGIEIPTATVNANHEMNHDYFYGFEDAHANELGVIDAKFQGNICRFIQHFPHKAEHAAITISKKINYAFNDEATLKKVATANLFAVDYRFNNHPFIVMFALRDINANEWLGCDYGGYWWNTKKHPLLIDVMGNVVPESKYKINQWLCQVMLDDKIFTGIELDQALINQYSMTPMQRKFNYLEHQGVLQIEPQDFVKSFKETPSTSPFIFIKKPSTLKIIKNNHNEQIPTEAKHDSPSKLVNGFFLSKAAQIERELKRIIDSSMSCKYYEKNETAVLMHENATMIQNIAAYLKDHGINIKIGHHQISKIPMIYIIEPRVTQLANILPWQHKGDINNAPKIVAQN